MLVSGTPTHERITSTENIIEVVISERHGTRMACARNSCGGEREGRHHSNDEAK